MGRKLKTITLFWGDNMGWLLFQCSTGDCPAMGNQKKNLIIVVSYILFLRSRIGAVEQEDPFSLI